MAENVSPFTFGAVTGQRRGRALNALAMGLSLWVGMRLTIHALSPLRQARDPAPLPHITLTDRTSTRAPVAQSRPRRHAAAPPRDVAFSLTAPSPPAAPPQMAHSSRIPVQRGSAPVEDETDWNLPSPPPPGSQRRRIYGSFWALVRADMPAGRDNMAGVGSLSASQVGARLVLPLPPIPRTLGLSVRLSAPLHSRTGKEIGLGLSARPFATANLEILAEKRLSVDGRHPQRTAIFAALGFAQLSLWDGLWGDGYLQAGGVNDGRVRGFVDGRISATRAVDDHLSWGVSSWGAAQQGGHRIDLGPTLILSGDNFRLSLDWRLRVSGNVQPSSGPAVTLGSDF